MKKTFKKHLASLIIFSLLVCSILQTNTNQVPKTESHISIYDFTDNYDK